MTAPHTSPDEQLPQAAIVHLDGPQRGKTEHLDEDRYVISGLGDGAVTLSDDADGALAPIAELERRGATFTLSAVPGAEVWVNGEPLQELVLASGDVVELGGGVVLRFRLYPPRQGRFKTMSEAFSDCLDCARYSASSPLRRAGVLASMMGPELMTQTAPAARIAMIGLLIAAIGLSAAALLRSERIEDRLESETARVEGLAELLERSSAEVLDASDLEAIRSEIERFRATEQRVEILEQQADARTELITSASHSIVFLQGAYAFVEPATGRLLRVSKGSAEGPGGGAAGEPKVQLGGAGPVLEIFYTGTGFIASGGGRIVTNRHVAEPWLFDDQAEELVRRGLEPVMRRFIGYVPGFADPFDVTLVAGSDHADVAVLRCGGETAALPGLELDQRIPAAGEDVTVLGYPTGIRAMIARSQRSVLPVLESRGAVNFWEAAEVLARGGHIAPLATRGIVGQVTPDSIVYDAGTTHGGSGGPVIDANGKVVAVNSAVMPDFAGANLGVPAAAALRLLEGGDISDEP